MLPHLTPLNGAQAGATVQVPPPPRFRPIVGAIREVDIAPHRHLEAKGRSAAQKAGLNYEAKIRSRLCEAYASIYMDQPFIHFRDDSGWRTCIPDGLDVYPDKIILIEIKYQHMPDAWWQLRKLYEPLVRKLFPLASVALLEICRTYDAATPFPEPAKLADSYEQFMRESKDGELGVYRWRM